jgi:hypothetical protein
VQRDSALPTFVRAATLGEGGKCCCTGCRICLGAGRSDGGGCVRWGGGEALERSARDGRADSRDRPLRDLRSLAPAAPTVRFPSRHASIEAWTTPVETEGKPKPVWRLLNGDTGRRRLTSWTTAKDAMRSPAAAATVRESFRKADTARRSPADGFTLWRSRNSRWGNRPFPTRCGYRHLCR